MYTCMYISLRRYVYIGFSISYAFFASYYTALIFRFAVVPDFVRDKKKENEKYTIRTI
jgi:hypothetical protein